MKSVTTCTAICEEFTDVVLIDNKHNSILINVAQEWFEVLNERLTSIGYKLIHHSVVGKTITCAYIPAI